MKAVFLEKILTIAIKRNVFKERAMCDINFVVSIRVLDTTQKHINTLNSFILPPVHEGHSGDQQRQQQYERINSGQVKKRWGEE